MARGKNTIVKEVRIGQVIPDMSAFMHSVLSTFKQGDMIIMDTTSNCLRAPTAESELSAFVGLATVDVTGGLPPAIYTTDVDASQAAPAQNGPIFGMTAKMILATGVNLSPGQKIYGSPASGARYVMPVGSGAASGTKEIGVYQGPAITTSAAGLEIEVLLGSRYPNDVLKF